MLWRGEREEVERREVLNLARKIFLFSMEMGCCFPFVFGGIVMKNEELGAREIVSTPFDQNPAAASVFASELDQKMKAAILEEEAELRRVVYENHMKQKEQLTNEELLSSLLYKGEQRVEIPPLRCSRVRIISEKTEKALDERFGVEARLTDKRLILTDVDVTSVPFLQREAKTSFPTRKSYRVARELRDDVWYYPFPLKNITGLMLGLSNKTKVSSQLSMKYNDMGLVAGVLGLLLMILGFGNGALLVVGFLLFIGGVIYAVGVPKFVTSEFELEQGLFREVRLGGLDPITQEKVILELTIDQDYSIHAIKDYLAKLQQLSQI